MNDNPAGDTLHPASPEAAGFDPAALARLDALAQEALAGTCPALVLLVARGGLVAFHRAYGWLDPEQGTRPTRLDSMFDLASVTKLYVVTAFMTLVERGAVALETPVAAVLPAFAGRRAIGPAEGPLTKAPLPADPAYAGQTVDRGQITFWHLLTHTSGLPAWRSLYREGAAPGKPVPLPHHVDPALRARRIAALYDQIDLSYPPGGRMVYSDLGLILLGEAVARLSGLSLEAYLRQAVLEPLGMARTTYNPLAGGYSAEDAVPTEVCVWRGRRCVGEVHDENAAGLGGVAGHAGLFAPAWEVGALGQAYLNGGMRLLSRATVAEMTRTQVDMEDNPRGLGWVLRSQSGSSSGQWFGPRSYGHTGFTGTSLWVDPDRALVVVLLTNRVYHGRDPAGILALRPRVHDAVIEALR